MVNPGHGIDRIDPSGNVTSILQFSQAYPESLAIETDGNVDFSGYYSGATVNGRIFRLDPSTGIVTQLAGYKHITDGFPSIAATNQGDIFVSWAGTVPFPYYPILGGGAVWSPAYPGRIDRIDPSGNVTTILQGQVVDAANGVEDSFGWVAAEPDGNIDFVWTRTGIHPSASTYRLDPSTGSVTQISADSGQIAVSEQGDVFLDEGNRIVRLEQMGNVTTILQAQRGDSFSGAAAAPDGNVDFIGTYLGVSGTFRLDPSTSTVTQISTVGGNYTCIAVQPLAALTPTVVVNPVGTTYDGSPQGTTGEAFGLGGVDLGPVTITYKTADGSAPVHAGTYTATGTFPGDQNYTSATGTATIVIDRATPTATIDPVAETTYDGLPHGTTGQVTGVNGESLGPITITYDTLDGSAPVHAGTYTATLSYAGDNDYNPASDSTTIVIDRATPTATIDPVAETTYDGLPHGTTGKVKGVNGEILGPVTITYDPGDNAEPVHAGAYKATISFAGNDDYTSASDSTTIVIDKADAVIAIIPFSIPYDGHAHQLIGFATGVQGEDLSSLLDLGTVGINAGTYWEFWTFNFDGSNPDYNSATGLDPFIIDPASLKVTVPSLAKTYGQAIDLGAVLGATIPTGVNNENLKIAYASAGAAASTPVRDGGYPITAHLSDGTGQLSNYSVKVVSGTLTVTPAPLTVTANNLTKIEGESNPQFTVSYSAFVLNQGPANLGGVLTFNTSATASSLPGIYAITPGGLTSTNYAITFVSGTLTVLSFSQATANMQVQVDAAGLPQGMQNSLDSQLQAAIASFNAGNTTAGVNQLEAFIHHVSAQSGNLIDAGLADMLIAEAQRIINAVG
jgi:hypothetical protein